MIKKFETRKKKKTRQDLHSLRCFHDNLLILAAGGAESGSARNWPVERNGSMREWPVKGATPVLRPSLDSSQKVDVSRPTSFAACSYYS